jgi:hypothetical protein
MFNNLYMQGPPGPQGPQGPPGPPGCVFFKSIFDETITITITINVNNGSNGSTCCTMGPIGLTGTMGPIGITGPQGTMGPITGTIGPIGLTGPQGTMGPITGTIGPIGSQGITGTMGPIGLTGPQGTIGPIGLTGPQGTIGPIGLTGTIGPIGLTGPQGTIGPIGPIGLTGTIGPIGLTGTMGPITGTMGPIGLTGTMGSSITNNNFVWAITIKTNSQTVVSAATFNNIIFTATPVIDGWTYAAGVFTCNQTGKYKVSYTVVMSATGGSRSASVRGVINGSEVIGSATTENIQSSSINQIWTNFFYITITITITAGQTFILQFAGSSSGNESINFTPSIAGETPISIERLVELLTFRCRRNSLGITSIIEFVN